MLPHRKNSLIFGYGKPCDKYFFHFVLLSRSTDFPQNYCSVERQFAEKERPVQ
jgi:hypothetical protein